MGPMEKGIQTDDKRIALLNLKDGERMKYCLALAAFLHGRDFRGANIIAGTASRRYMQGIQEDS